MFIQVGLHKYKVFGYYQTTQFLEVSKSDWSAYFVGCRHILGPNVSGCRKNKHYPHQPALSLAILIVAAARKEAFVVEDHNAAFGLMQLRRLRVWDGKPPRTPPKTWGSYSIKYVQVIVITFYGIRAQKRNHGTSFWQWRVWTPAALTLGITILVRGKPALVSFASSHQKSPVRWPFQQRPSTAITSSLPRKKIQQNSKAANRRMPRICKGARDFHSFCSRFACSKVKNKPSIKSPSMAGKDHDDRLALGLPGLPGLPYEKTMPEISHYATCWGCPIIEQQLVPTAQYCGSHENTRERNTHWMCLKMEKSPATLTVDWAK